MKSSHTIKGISAFGCAVLLACGSDTGTTPESTRPITIASGGSVSDTVGTRLVQALIVEVRANGVLRPGAIVRFETQPSTDPKRSYEYTALISRLTSTQYTTFVADSTDASGRARVLVQLGSVSGSTGVTITVPELGVVDTAKFTVRPGNPARITMAVRDTAIIAGASYAIGASVADRYGNARTDVPTYTSVNPYATVDAAGVVKATSAGRALITVKAGAFTDTARASIIPDYTIVGVSAVGGQAVIATAKLDGTGFLRLTSTSSNIMLPRFNPAGTRVVFYEGDPNYDARLYSVDLAGTRTLVNVVAGPATKFFPAYSTDGQQLFFSGNPASAYYSEIWRSQSDGSGVTRLTTSVNSTATEPSPSPDGKKLVFTAGGFISTLDLNTKVVTSLGVRGSTPKYSPDGTQILFFGPGPYETNLGVMDASGSNVRMLSGRSYDTYGAPNWSPDGAWIIVRSYSSLDLVRVSNFEVLPIPRLNFWQASFKP